MGIEVTISSKGQIVIPKDVREELGLQAGGKLMLERSGRRLILEAPSAPRPRISYDEFQRRVPRYDGPAATIEEMDAAVDRMFAGQGER